MTKFFLAGALFALSTSALADEIYTGEIAWVTFPQDMVGTNCGGKFINWVDAGSTVKVLDNRIIPIKNLNDGARVEIITNVYLLPDGAPVGCQGWLSAATLVDTKHEKLK